MSNINGEVVVYPLSEVVHINGEPRCQVVGFDITPGLGDVALFGDVTADDIEPDAMRPGVSVLTGEAAYRVSHSDGLFTRFIGFFGENGCGFWPVQEQEGAIRTVVEDLTGTGLGVYPLRYSDAQPEYPITQSGQNAA